MASTRFATKFHSRLQRNLMNAINAQTTDYEAIQELRCIVPPSMIYAGEEVLPTVGNISGFAVAAVIAMTGQR